MRASHGPRGAAGLRQVRGAGDLPSVHARPQLPRAGENPGGVDLRKHSWETGSSETEEDWEARGGERGGALLALGGPNSQETEVLAEVRVLEQGGRSLGFQRHQHGCPGDALREGA